jgi:hypothetical protein
VKHLGAEIKGGHDADGRSAICRGSRH